MYTKTYNLYTKTTSFKRLDSGTPTAATIPTTTPPGATTDPTQLPQR